MRKISVPNMKKGTFVTVYAAFVLLTLLMQVFFWLSPSHAAKIGSVYLWPTAITMMALLLYRRRLALPAGMPVLLIMVAWTYLTCIFNGDYYLTYNIGFMLGVLLACGICYPTFLLMESESRAKWLRIFAHALVLVLALVAWLGVYAAFTGKPILSPFSGEPLGLYTDENRLYVFGQHPNGNACNFSIAFLLALYLACVVKKPVMRALYGVACVGLYAGIALTDSRTVMATLAVGLGMWVLLVFLKRVQIRKTALRIGASIGAALAAALVTFVCFSPVYQGVLALQPNGQSVGSAQIISLAESLLPSAAAEAPNTPEQAPVAQRESGGEEETLERSFANDIGTLRGRTDIWRAGFESIRQRPVTLLIGMLDSEVARIPIRMLGRAETYHMHNFLLEVLMITGLPGLFLCLIFVCKLVISAFRLFFAPGAPVSVKMLTIIPAMLLANGMLEAYPFLGGRLMDMLFFVFSGAVIAYAGAFAPKARARGKAKAAGKP